MQSTDIIAVRTRISVRLAFLNMSIREASIQAGLNPDTLGKFLTGKTQSLKASNMAALARVLDVSESWVMGSSNETGLGEFPFGVRFGGIVEAGAFRPEDGLNQDAELRRIPLPHDTRYPADFQYAFQVVGDSMTEAKIFEGMHVLAVEVHAWERLHGEPGDGRLVVVARTRNGHGERELTIKRLRLFRDRMELRPESQNPTHKPLVFPLPAAQDDQAEARIIAVVLSATWILA